MKREILAVLSSMILSSCTNTIWYKGAIIQYKTVEKNDDGEYIINILGSMPHSKEDLESAALDRAEELCKGNATLLESKLGRYNTMAVGGGVVIEGSSPEITVRATCNNA